MKKVIAITALVSLGFTSFAGEEGKNASSSASQTVNLALSNAIEITFSGTGEKMGTDVTIPFKTVNDYANGVQSSDQKLLVRSNKDFTVSIKTNSKSFSYKGSTSPSPKMPVKGVLGLQVTGNNTGGSVAAPFSEKGFSTLSSEEQKLLVEAKRGGKQAFSIKYEATPGFAYPAGTYTVDVVYTATQN